MTTVMMTSKRLTASHMFMMLVTTVLTVNICQVFIQEDLVFNGLCWHSSHKSDRRSAMLA